MYVEIDVFTCVQYVVWCERLAEYGWKPHRAVSLQKEISRASSCRSMREKQRSTVSSKSRFQTVLLQPYSASLSDETV